MYISLRVQELATCRRIGYKFYCEEPFVVKHKTTYRCESAIYFDLDAKIIKENCEFQHYFNNTDVKPVVLDGGHKIVLAYWPDNKHVICNNKITFLLKFQATHMF